MARGGGLNLAGALVNQASLLLLTLVITRQLNTTAAGIYLQAYGLRRILQIVALAGMRATLTRFVAANRVDHDGAALRGNVRLGIGLSVGLAALLAVGLVAASGWMAEAFYDDPAAATVLRWVALGLPAATATEAVLSCTQGYRTMKPSALVGAMFEPIARLVLTVVALAAGGGVLSAVIVQQIAAVLTLALATAWLLRLMGDDAWGAARYEPSPLLRFAAVVWASSVALEGIRWADTQILGFLEGPEAVAHYQLAARPVLMAAIAANALVVAFAPRAADLFERDRLPVLRDLYRAYTVLAVRTTLPLLIPLLVVGERVLALWSDDVTSAVAVMWILAVGVLFDAGTQAGGPALNMAGRTLTNLAVNASGFAVNVTLNILLIPVLGVEGAALSWSLTFLLAGSVRALLARWQVVGVLPWSRALVPVVLAGLPATVVAVVVAVVVPGTVGILVVGLASVAAYVGASVAFGIDAQERHAFKALIGREPVIVPS
jgi:O-antigen/teichoic acid export membrane protein